MPAAPPEPGFGHGRRRSPRCRPGWATALGSTGYPRKLSQWDGANICSHTYIHMHMKDIYIYIYIPDNPPAVIGVGGGTPPYRGRGDAVPTALGPGKSKILDLFRPNCSCNTNRGRFPTCPKCHATVAQSQRPWARENPNSRIYSGQTCKSTLPRAHFRGPPRIPDFRQNPPAVRPPVPGRRRLPAANRGDRRGEMLASLRARRGGWRREGDGARESPFRGIPPRAVGTAPPAGAAVTQSQRPWARENPNSRIYSGQTCKSTLPRAHFRGPRISVKIPRPSDRPFPGAGACPPRTAATGAERC